jgi:predicted AlkP superfamily pyrophosphatase or phosphodiesterase
MKRILLCVLAAACLLTAAPKKPKLVLVIVIDQFRYDYLTRYRGEYHSGFDRLLTKGAVFTNARYQHFPPLTALGHSLILSGAMPSVSGIAGNDWYDREEGKHVTSVSDSHTQLVGGNGGEGASPHQLLVSTIGDELKMADGGKSRVIGISLKDRAAVLLVGHMADGAYWFDPMSGNFVSSTYYFRELPGWVKDFNNGRPAEKYRGVAWLNHKLPENLKELYGTSDESPLESSSFGNELVELLAERAVTAEQLGRRDVTDVLAISFTSNDKVGHDYGPDSPEEHDVLVRADRLIEKLFQTVDRQVGLDNVLVVLAGDHGAAPAPEVNAARKMPGGRILVATLKQVAQAALEKKYGAGDWVAGNWDAAVYLNQSLIARKKLDPAEVDRAAAQALMAMPHVSRVYTREEITHGELLQDDIGRLITNGFHVRRGPDIEVVTDPYWIVSDKPASHTSPYGYDVHVPVIFMGPDIRAGRYDASIAVNDVAPTLATILDVETPSGSTGRVLTEIFAQ